MLEVKVPDIGDFKDVPVIEVLVKPGDAVSAEQSLVTLESDKATLEVPSPSSGVVQSVAVKVGDKVSEGSVLLALDAKSPAKAAAASSKPPAAAAAAPAAPPVAAAAATAAAPREAPPAAGKAASARNGNGLARHDAVNLGDARGRGDLAGEGPSGNPPPVSSTEIRVPDIGDFDSVPVIEVFVKPGDIVKVDDPIVTLESDKATMDVPSPIAGVVQGVRVAVGDKVREGTVLCSMSAVDKPVAPPVPRPAAAGAGAPAATAPPPTSKPAAAAPATPSAASAAASAAPVAVDAAAFRRAHASPSVRLFARELGVDLAKVKGTGPHDRILREDVQAFVKTTLAAPAPPPAPAARTGGLEVLPWPQIDFTKFGAIESKPLSRIKKIAGANLARNWVMIPHVTQFDDADITDLEALRVTLNKEYEKSGPKVTMLAFLIKASVAALARFPDFNASLVTKPGGDELVLKKYCNIGFAADTPNGLVVPVIRNADQKGVLAIATEMGALSVKAREGKLTPGEMQGGCFSISSLGGIGGTAFTPIINAPEVAILGVSKSVMKPVWDGKAFAPRLTLPLSLSYDHRVIDGAAAARFTSYLASLLGDMRRSLLSTRAPAVAALLLAMAATFAAGAAQARESVVTIPTRDGVTLSYILDAPNDAPKKAVAISFIGGFGQMHLDKRTQPLKFPKAMNALLRIRHQLAGPDIADVIVDVPSDHQLGGMEDYFRGTAEHAADIRAVIADVKKRYPDAKIFLIGTSRGTISAASLGVSLHDLVAGTILTSTVTHWDKMGTALSRFDFDTLKVPTLFIHHVNDGCATSPYAGVQALAGKFPVVPASGGDPPESGPCDPLAPHGFWGLDTQVVAVMQDFMLGKPYPHAIP